MAASAVVHCDRTNANLKSIKKLELAKLFGVTLTGLGQDYTVLNDADRAKADRTVCAIRSLVPQCYKKIADIADSWLKLSDAEKTDAAFNNIRAKLTETAIQYMEVRLKPLEKLAEQSVDVAAVGTSPLRSRVEQIVSAYHKLETDYSNLSKLASANSNVANQEDANEQSSVHRKRYLPEQLLSELSELLKKADEYRTKGDKIHGACKCFQFYTSQFKRLHGHIDISNNLSDAELAKSGSYTDKLKSMFLAKCREIDRQEDILRRRNELNTWRDELATKSKDMCDKISSVSSNYVDNAKARSKVYQKWIELLTNLQLSLNELKQLGILLSREAPTEIEKPPNKFVEIMRKLESTEEEVEARCKNLRKANQAKAHQKLEKELNDLAERQNNIIKSIELLKFTPPQFNCDSTESTEEKELQQKIKSLKRMAEQKENCLKALPRFDEIYSAPSNATIPASIAELKDVLWCTLHKEHKEHMQHLFDIEDNSFTTDFYWQSKMTGRQILDLILSATACSGRDSEGENTTLKEMREKAQSLFEHAFRLKGLDDEHDQCDIDEKKFDDIRSDLTSYIDDKNLRPTQSIDINNLLSTESISKLHWHFGQGQYSTVDNLISQLKLTYEGWKCERSNERHRQSRKFRSWPSENFFTAYSKLEGKKKTNFADIRALFYDLINLKPKVSFSLDQLALILYFLRTYPSCISPLYFHVNDEDSNKQRFFKHPLTARQFLALINAVAFYNAVYNNKVKREGDEYEAALNSANQILTTWISKHMKKRFRYPIVLPPIGWYKLGKALDNLRSYLKQNKIYPFPFLQQGSLLSMIKELKKRSKTISDQSASNEKSEAISGPSASTNADSESEESSPSEEAELPYPEFNIHTRSSWGFCTIV